MHLMTRGLHLLQLIHQGMHIVHISGTIVHKNLEIRPQDFTLIKQQ